MTCAEVEILLADHVEGNLRGEQSVALEAHLAGCRLCAALAEDSAEALAFLERVPQVEPPPELVTKLLYEASHGTSRSAMRPSWARRVFGAWAEPVLQPRFAMGMAMTMLSFAMMFRMVGISERQLKPSDLDPVKLWNAAETRVTRIWDRGVKYYENLRIVYEIQSRMQEWNQEQSPAPAPSGDKK